MQKPRLDVIHPDHRPCLCTNRFGFFINRASGMVIVAEACTNVPSHVWTVLTMASGLAARRSSFLFQIRAG